MKTIHLKELNFTYSRSSGAGGQNVNKVNTKVTLSWPIYKTKSINGAIVKRFCLKYKRYMTDQNIVKLTSQRFRVQARNIADCVEKLNHLVDSVRVPERKRIKTKPTKSSVERRIKTKKNRSSLKKLRQEKF